MQAQIDCFYCYLKQVVTCMDIADIEEDRQYQILFDLMDEIKKMDRTKTPAENTTEMLLQLYHKIGNDDPYQESKVKSNILARKLYPELKDYLKESPDRLYDALKISVAGNIIDLGINKSYDLDASLKYSLNADFARNNYKRFVEKLNASDSVVIIGDNAGEIVFDKLLVEELIRLEKKITYIVKDSPILNDATMDDARQAGMDKIAEVITTGSPYLGMPLSKVSGEVKKLMEKSSLVISKGQANFETLEHEKLAKDRIFFLLKIKCACIGEAAGAKLGNIVFFTR
ncbi:ARMT1-like domain-containing protein [Desulfoscipio sp. XC116]|uniref:damage-control phosphatase ARMT1 family protein n=1 Tax=Desulfoscipio sp. XC116 TaxID=3144975 RepID=UPI00325AFDD0